jgi:hypothetical protein
MSEDFKEASKNLIFSEQKIETLEQLRQAKSAIEWLSSDARNRGDYESIAKMKEALGLRMSDTGFTCFYSEQEQCYILL